MSYSDNFLKLMDHVLKNEGGYVNNPNDPGSETYKGIARAFWSDWDGWAIVDKVKLDNRSVFNSKNSSKIDQLLSEQGTNLQDKIYSFYYKNFYNPLKLDELPAELHLNVYDHGVNAGLKSALKLIQESVNNYIDKFNVSANHLVEDGVIGPSTLKLISQCNPITLNYIYSLKRISFYIQISSKNTKLHEFFRGWIIRVKDLTFSN